MGVRLLVAEAEAEQCVGGDGGGGPGEQAVEGVRAVAGQFHLLGDLAEGGLDAVAPLRDGPLWFERLYAREPNLMKVILDPREPGK